MADSKITALTALTAADPINDMLPIVDVSDTTMAASGTTKKISVNNILGASGTATLASATITGAATVGTTLGVTGQSTLTGNVGIGVVPSAWGTYKGLQVGYASLAGYAGSDTLLGSNVYFDGGAFRYIAAGLASSYRQLSGSHQWSTAVAGVNPGDALTFLAQATLDASGNFSPVGNVVMANTKGIDFSATASGSGTMTSELLNDYEEGTFTIALTFGGGNTAMTTSFSTGQYTKIGRQVSVNGLLVLTAKGSSTGAAVISGLPFANGNSLDALSAVSLRLSNVSYVGSIQSLKLMNTATFNFEQLTEAGSNSSLSDANFSNTSDIVFNFTYNVA